MSIPSAFYSSSPIAAFFSSYLVVDQLSLVASLRPELNAVTEPEERQPPHLLLAGLRKCLVKLEGSVGRGLHVVSIANDRDHALEGLHRRGKTVGQDAELVPSLGAV
jgi:hypothetical protein